MNIDRCVNVNHPEFKKLVEESKMNPLVLKSKIGVWQEYNNTDAFPSLKEIADDSSYATAMREGITIDNAAMEISRLIGSAMATDGFKTNPNLRSLSGDKQLYGVLRDHVITLAERDGNVHATAPRHESMHYILDYCLSPKDFKAVTDAAIAKVNKEYIALDKAPTATLADGIEYICEGFETFRETPEKAPKTILGRLYKALVKLFNQIIGNTDVINRLYVAAESGAYANTPANLFNNNPYLDERPLAVETQYNNNAAISLLETKCGSIANITAKIAFIKDVVLMQSPAIGKLITTEIEMDTAMSKLYYKLTDANTYNKYKNIDITYNGNKMQLNEYLSGKDINFVYRNINKIIADENNRNKIVDLFNDIYEDIIKYDDYNFSLQNILFMFPIVESANIIHEGESESDTTLAKIFVQQLDNTIDIRRIVSNVEKFRRNDKHVSENNYQTSYEKQANINDLVSLKFQHIINNIVYKQEGKYEKHLQWQEFTSIMLEMAYAFRKGETLSMNKGMLLYNDIVNKFHELSKVNTANKSMYEAIYDFFRSDYKYYNQDKKKYMDYDSNNATMVKDMMMEEYDNIDNTFDFTDYGYGFIVKRINDYLNRNSKTGQLFATLSGENYDENIQKLKAKRDNIEVNIFNTISNYFNSIGRNDLVVADTNGKVTAKTNDNEKLLTLRLKNTIDASLFARDKYSSNNTITGTSDMSKQIYDTVKKDNEDADTYILTKNTNGSIYTSKVVLPTKKNTNTYSALDIAIMKGILIDFYGNNIDSEILFNVTDGKYMFNKGVGEHLRELIDTVIHNELKDRSNNADTSASQWRVLDHEFIKKNTKGIILSIANKRTTNAEQNTIPVSVVTNPLINHIGSGSAKLQNTAANAFIRSDSKADENSKSDKKVYLLNPLLAKDFSIVELDVDGGLEGDVFGRAWDNMTVADRINTFFNVYLKKEDSKYYNVMLQHTGDRGTTYHATLETNPYFDLVNENKKTVIKPNENNIGKSVRRLVEYHKQQYNTSKQRLKDNNIVANTNDALTVNGEEVYRDYNNMSDAAKHIESHLIANIDYLIVGNKYMVGNAGKNKIFGYDVVNSYKATNKKLTTNNDYYDYYMSAMTGQKELFYEMLNDNNFNPSKEIKMFDEAVEDKVSDKVAEFYKDNSSEIVEVKMAISGNEEFSDFHTKAIMYKFLSVSNVISKGKDIKESITSLYNYINNDLEKANNDTIHKENRYGKIGNKKDFHYYQAYKANNLINKNTTFEEYMIKNANVRTLNNNYMLDAYYYTHTIINESIGNIMAGTTDFTSDDMEYIKRSMGYTAPTNEIRGNPDSETPNIGDNTRFALLQDIPGNNSLYGGESSNLKSDGRVLYPMFYQIALKNSAGGDLSFVSSGAVKTINHHYDMQTGKLHYMKCSEFAINYSEYEKQMGKEVYRISLDHNVRIKVGNEIKTVNLYDKFKELYKSYKGATVAKEGIYSYSKYSREAAFNNANKDLLDFMWQQRAYDEAGADIGRVYDHITHKVMFQSAVKLGVTGVNHWVRSQSTFGNASLDIFSYPATDQMIVQEVSNKNYGMQQNKLQSTQKQDKNLMSQMIKLLGVTEINSHVYKNIISSLNNIVEDRLQKVYGKDAVADKMNKYGNYITASVLQTYNAKHLMLKRNNSKTFEQVKSDIITFMLKEIDKAIVPVVDGNIMVQQPTDTYFTKINGVQQEVKIEPFRYFNANGEMYANKNTLLQDIKDGKDITIGLQEAVAPFSHQETFGLNDDSVLSDVFTVGSDSFYFTSKDYRLTTAEDGKQKLTPYESYNDFKTRIKKSLVKYNNVNKDKAQGSVFDAFQYLKASDYHVKLKVLADVRKNTNKKSTNLITKEEVEEGLARYMWNLNEACNLYALRIPSNNASSGFPTRIVEFNNAMDNTILTSADKSLLDGSDFDIDELNVYFPTVDSYKNYEELNSGNKFKADIYNTITAYYGNPANSNFVLSSITTKNIKEIAAEYESDEHYINTANYFFNNQELCLVSQKLVGHMVNIQTTTSEMVSNLLTVNDMKLSETEQQWVDSKKILSSPEYMSWFLDVTTELVNAATDSVNLGNVLGALNITPYTSNIIAGVLHNLHNKQVFDNFLFQQQQKNPDYTEEMLLKEYGLIAVDGNDNTSDYVIRDTTVDANKSVKYALKVIQMACNTIHVKNAVAKLTDANRVSYTSKKTDIGTILSNTANKSNLDKIIADFAHQGLSLYYLNLLMVTDIKKRPIELTNTLFSLASILGVVNDGTADGVANGLIALLDNINATELKDGESDNTTMTGMEIAELADNYSLNKTMLSNIHDNINYKLLLKNNKYWQNKIRMLAKTFLEKNKNFYSEKLIESVLARNKKENKRIATYDDNYKKLQKEVDKIVVGNSIKALPDNRAIISYTINGNSKSYDIRTDVGRVNLIRDFLGILNDMKVHFDNKNIFLNFIRAINIKNNTVYGIENILYSSEVDKKDIANHYDDIYQAAKFNISDDVFNNMTAAEQRDITKVRNGILAIEAYSLLTNGFIGNSSDYSIVARPVLKEEMIKHDDKIKKVIDTLSDEVEKADEDKSLLYSYLVGKMGSAYPGIKYDHESYENVISMDKLERIYTLSHRNIDSASVVFRENKIPIANPYGNNYNMYGVNGLVHPIVSGNKTLRYMADSIVKNSIDNEAVIRPSKDKIIYESIDGKHDLYIKNGDLILIGNNTYRVNKDDNNEYYFSKVESSNKEKLSALDIRKDNIKNIASKSQIEAFLGHLTHVFPNIDIEYIYDKNGEIAFVSGGKVYLNMDKIGADIPIHELAHIFTMIIRETAPEIYNNLYNEAIEHIKADSPIVRYIQETYGDLSTEDMVFEIIGNIIQREQGDMMEAFLLEQRATEQEATMVRKLLNSVKEFFKKIGETLHSIFGGNWKSMNKMTISDMGNILTDAIKNGKVLSHMTSQELQHLNYNNLYAANNQTNITNTQDLINGLVEYTTPFSKMTDIEIENKLYQESLANGGKLWVGSKVYDFSKFSEEDTRKKIREGIVSSFSQNMPIIKNNIINGINTTDEKTFNNLTTNIQKSLGRNTDGYYMYSNATAHKIATILQIDDTKKYYTLEDMVNNKDNIMDNGEMRKYKKAFAEMKDLLGYNPIVAVEYADDNQMIISLYDIVGQPLSYYDRQIGQSNILFRYGITSKQANLAGITLSNNLFDVHSVVMTVMINKLKREGVVVRDAQVTHISKGNRNSTVSTKRVNTYEVNKNIELMNGFKEFSDKIDNATIKEIFNTPADRLITNDIDYDSLLISLYDAYYQTPGQQYNPDDENAAYYDYMIKNNYQDLSTGKLRAEDKMNLIMWRLHQLSKIETTNKTPYQINETRLLLEAYKALKGSAKLIYTMNKVAVLKATTSLWNTFDVDSEELQFIRSMVITNQNKIVHEVRKRKNTTKEIWKHFSGQSNQIQKHIANPYYMYEHLFATRKTKNGEDAFAGRILWTTDISKDEYARQAKERNISDKDLEMANKLCDNIEQIWIEALKHEAWKRYGTEEQYVSTGTVRADGSTKMERRKLTDKEWMEKLYSRGYKRGMIPIMKKHYIDGAKSVVKRMGLEVKYTADEYTNANPEIIQASANDQLMDEITNIFTTQLNAGDTDLGNQTNENNIASVIDEEQGYKGRNKLLGFVEDEVTKEVMFDANRGMDVNKDINKDLEFVFTFFDLAMTRKRIHERETLPVLNEFVKLLEIGKTFTTDKNNEAIVNYIRNFMEMSIKGSSYKIKEFGPKIGGSSVGEYLSTATKAFVGMQMFLNVNVAINSALINTLKSTVETISNDQFVGRNMMFGFKTAMKDMKTSYKRALDLQIIREGEHETYNPGYGGSVSNKSIFTSFTSNLLNWGTDSYVRTAVLLARMKEDGIIDAYVDDVYDDTKDKRFFNADGSQTNKQKTLYEFMKHQHKLEDIEMIIDANGNEHLSQCYTWEECNAIKEYADKRLIGGYSSTVKAIIGNSVLGRQALMYFNWFPSAFKGIVGSSMSHETIFKYLVDEQTGKVYKDLYFSEGMLRTLYHVGRRAWQSKSLNVFNHANGAYEKKNLARLMSTVSLGVFLKILYNFMIIDDDDKNDRYGVLPNYRILKNIDYASEGLFMFLYTDGLQRIAHPFPLADNIFRILDNNGSMSSSFIALTQNVPLYSTVNAFTEVATGEKLTKKIKDTMK